MTFMLAVSGKKQSGKDTLVSNLSPILQTAGSVEYFTFADQLKKFLVEGMGLDHSSTWGTDEEKNRLTPYMWDKLPYEIRRSNARRGSKEPRTGQMSGREIMQVFGTDIMREFFDEKIWVNACFRAIERSKPVFALLPDMRFPSELNPWIDRGGYIIRLTRDVSGGDAHPSEVALDGNDWSSYPSQVLVIPADATKTECLCLSLNWLRPRIENYFSTSSDAEESVYRFEQAAAQAVVQALRISDE